MKFRAKIAVFSVATLCSIASMPAKPSGSAGGEVQQPKSREAIEQLKRSAEREHADRHDHEQATRTWKRTAERSAHADRLLSGGSVPQMAPADLPSALLKDKAASLHELLTLKQLITGSEPAVATFEVPLTYETVTNAGELLLAVDPVEGLNVEQARAVKQEFSRAPNGNCLLVWHTGYDTPGKHALQAVLAARDKTGKRVDVAGPLLPFVSSNICQYSESSAHFDPTIGATLMAKVTEPNATYRVEFISVDGKKVRTIRGTTTNGIIKAYWDLNDEGGQRFTGEAFDSVFHVTLPSTGKSFTQTGP